MKLKSLILAMGCMALAACSNDMEPQVEVVKDAVKTAPLTITVNREDVATTRMDFTQETDGSISAKWKDGDALSVIYWTGTAIVNEKFEIDESSISDDGQTANFTCKSSQWASLDPGGWTSYVSIYYPYSDTKDSSNRYYLDLRTQEGTLASLANYTVLSGVAEDVYFSSFPKITLSNSTYVLRIEKGKKLLDEKVSGTVDLQFLGDKYGAFLFYFEDYGMAFDRLVTVKNVKLKNGKLDQDVYVVFAESTDKDWVQKELTMSFTLGTTYVFELNKGNKDLKKGVCYTVNSLEQKTVKGYIGKIVGDDGNFYDTANDATTAGATAIAMVAYEDDSKYLAVALEDIGIHDNVSEGRQTWANAKTKLETWMNDHVVTIGSWRFPTKDDWMYIFQGCGGSTYNPNATTFNFGRIDELIKAAAGDDASLDYWYWTATDDGDNAWCYSFQDFEFALYSKRYGMNARAVLEIAK